MYAVAALQDVLGNGGIVHARAAAAVQIKKCEAAVFLAQLQMKARYVGVVEDDVVVGFPADCDHQIFEFYRSVIFENQERRLYCFGAAVPVVIAGAALVSPSAVCECSA